MKYQGRMKTGFIKVERFWVELSEEAKLNDEPKTEKSYYSLQTREGKL